MPSRRRLPCLHAVISIRYASSLGGFPFCPSDGGGCCSAIGFRARFAEGVSRQICRYHSGIWNPLQLPLVSYSQTLFARDYGPRRGTLRLRQRRSSRYFCRERRSFAGSDPQRFYPPEGRFKLLEPALSPED